MGIYTFALYLTQAVATYYSSTGGDEDNDLLKHYGSVSLSMFTLFQSITGGVDWDACARPLMDHISTSSAVIFSVYVCIAQFAMLNVVTSVFVDSVLESAKDDKDQLLLQSGVRLFEKILPEGLEGTMTYKALLDNLDMPEVTEFLKAINVKSN